MLLDVQGCKSSQYGTCIFHFLDSSPSTQDVYEAVVFKFWGEKTYSSWSGEIIQIASSIWKRSPFGNFKLQGFLRHNHWIWVQQWQPFQILFFILWHRDYSCDSRFGMLHFWSFLHHGVLRLKIIKYGRWPQEKQVFELDESGPKSYDVEIPINFQKEEAFKLHLNLLGTTWRARNISQLFCADLSQNKINSKREQKIYGLDKVKLIHLKIQHWK